MKYYSEYSKQYVEKVFKALNKHGAKAALDKSFSDESIKSISELLRNYVVYHQSYYDLLNAEGLIKNNLCPYTGESLTASNRHYWEYWGRKIYLSKEGRDLMEQEAEEEMLENAKFGDKMRSEGSTVPGPTYDELKQYFEDKRRNPEKYQHKSKKCYIATTCFKDEFAGEVIILKYYRDRIMAQSYIGAILIKLYYFFSPSLAKVLSRFPIGNALIRDFLKKFIVRKIK